MGKKKTVAKTKTVLRTGGAKEKKKADWHSAHAHLFPSKPRDFGIGRDVQHETDLSRYVKWPAYIRLQRQKAILKKRLKVPPSIHQFTNVLEKSNATTLFRLLHAYRPETAAQKKDRLVKTAEAASKDQETKSSKPKVLKFGLSHVTTLVEQRQAKLVVIAHDVDPIELVLWLPALCRKMQVPYVIVKGKARLGHLVHLKNAACVALTEVASSKDQATLDQLVAAANAKYGNENPKRWGGGIMGVKTQAVLKKRAKAAAAEAKARA
jgi:large subunit ribosomal protein L7Ae